MPGGDAATEQGRHIAGTCSCSSLRHHCRALCDSEWTRPPNIMSARSRVCCSKDPRCMSHAYVSSAVTVCKEDEADRAPSRSNEGGKMLGHVRTDTCQQPSEEDDKAPQVASASMLTELCSFIPQEQLYGRLRARGAWQICLNCSCEPACKLSQRFSCPTMILEI